MGTWCPGKARIFCADQFHSRYSIALSASFSRPSAQSEALNRTKRGFSRHTIRTPLTSRWRMKREQFSKTCLAFASERVFVRGVEAVLAMGFVNL